MLALLLSLAFAGTPGPALHVGDTAYLFTLPALNEDAALRAVARTSVALSDYTGVMPGFPAKGVVVHFMRKDGGEVQLQALARLSRKYDSKGIRFVAVLAGPGEIAAVSGWVEQQNPGFPVLRDAHDIVAGRYGITTWPTTFVVDSEGDVAAIGVPKADLETSLDTVLAGFFTR